MKMVSERLGAGRWEGFTSAFEGLELRWLCIVKNFPGAGGVPYT